MRYITETARGSLDGRIRVLLQISGDNFARIAFRVLRIINVRILRTRKIESLVLCTQCSRVTFYTIIVTRLTCIVFLGYFRPNSIRRYLIVLLQQCYVNYCILVMRVYT